MNNPWTSPFYKYEADNKHNIKLEKNLPKPIITINLNEYYGERQLQADSAIKIFQEAAYVARVGNQRSKLKK